MPRVLIPVPERDFDVTEVAVPWRLLRDADCQVVFATPDGGRPPAADPRLLSGVVFGQLGAAREPLAFYRQLERADEYQAPRSYRDLDPTAFDGLLLPGGHAPGMKPYLESRELQAAVAAFWALERPVAAICHGVLVLSRTRGPDGRSLLWDRRTTCLPRYMERTAFLATCWRVGRYFRTYPTYVEAEVRASLADPTTQFVRGPVHLFARGSARDDGAAFVVRDGHYVSGRWPGDAYRLGRELVAMTRAANSP